MKAFNLFIGALGLACSCALGIKCVIAGDFGTIDIIVLIVSITFGILNIRIGLANDD
jgi:hypothetical protein